MKIEVKHRWSEKILFVTEADSLRLGIEAAVKAKAYLQGAYLQGAYLQGAIGISPNRSTPLRILLEQVGKIRAYKLLTERGEGPYVGGTIYEIGKKYSVDDADTSEEVQCSRGINLATLDWCMHGWRQGYRILVAEFIKKDIAAIPNNTNGKFRVHRCTIVGEKDLVQLGLVKEEAMTC